MTEPFRLPLELSADETATLRTALAQMTYPPTDFPLIRRLEDHTGRIMREAEAERHARVTAGPREDAADRFDYPAADETGWRF